MMQPDKPDRRVPAYRGGHRARRLGAGLVAAQLSVSMKRAPARSRLGGTKGAPLGREAFDDPAYRADHTINGDASRAQRDDGETHDDRQDVVLHFPKVESDHPNRDNRSADSHRRHGGSDPEPVEPMTAPQHAAVHAPVHARAGIALKRSPGFGPGGRFRPRDRRMGKEHASAHADAVRALGNVVTNGR